MYSLIKPLLFSLPPHRAHALAMAGLLPLEHMGLLRSLVRQVTEPFDPRIAVRKMGLVFPSPVGLAGGFDKNADRPRALSSLGFGHVELGTVTAEPQAPNPGEVLFRLPEDRALINRLGFPNRGAEVVAARIAARKSAISVPVGVSIGKSRSVPLEPLAPVIEDYLASYRVVRAVADFIVVNVSSPNTKGLRAMQGAGVARRLFEALREEEERAPGAKVPLLVKIAPDLEDDAIDAVADAVLATGFAGVVATNTTIARDDLATPRTELARIGDGGLSGKPLFSRSLSVVRRVRQRLGPDPCVVGVGGIDSVESARAMLHAGADLLQLYTGFIYRGPGLPRAIARGLALRP